MCNKGDRKCAKRAGISTTFLFLHLLSVFRLKANHGIKFTNMVQGFVSIDPKLGNVDPVVLELSTETTTTLLSNGW